MATYKTRALASNGSTMVLVHPSNYKRTLEMGFKVSTARVGSATADSLRRSITSAIQESVTLCADKCAASRRETVSCEYSFLLGQEQDYYARKLESLKTVQDALNKDIAMFSDIVLGINPSVSAEYVAVAEKV